MSANEGENKIEKLTQSIQENFEKKITIVLKATPPAKQITNDSESQFLSVTFKGQRTFATLMNKLREQFSELKNQNLIFYCGNNFAISPSSTICDVFNNFGTNGKLIISYNITESWG